MHSRIIVGAKVVVYVNGRLFGRITAFSFESITNRKPIHTVDIPWAQELAATTVTTRGSMKILRLSGDGGAQGAQLVAPQHQISAEKYMTILVIDRSTETTLFQSDNCQVNSESWEVDARGRMEGSIGFESILWFNETSV